MLQTCSCGPATPTKESVIQELSHSNHCTSRIVSSFVVGDRSVEAQRSPEGVVLDCAVS